MSVMNIKRALFCLILSLIAIPFGHADAKPSKASSEISQRANNPLAREPQTLLSRPASTDLQTQDPDETSDELLQQIYDLISENGEKNDTIADLAKAKSIHNFLGEKLSPDEIANLADLSTDGPDSASSNQLADATSFEDINGIAAIVESQVITLDDLRREITPLARQLRIQTKSADEFEKKIHLLQQNVLQNLIDRVLVINDFKEEGLQVPQFYVDNAYDETIRDQFEGDRTRFLKYLEAQGKTVREYRNDLKNDIIINYMRAQKQKSQAEISPEKIEQFYQEHLNQFKLEERAHIHQIMLTVTGDKTIDNLRDEANAIMEELDDGASFYEVASRYTSESDLGWLNHSDLFPTVANEAFFNTKVGQHSKPVLVNNTVFILFVEDKKSAGTRPLDDVREEIEILLSSQLARENIEKWLAQLRKDAYIRYYI